MLPKSIDTLRIDINSGKVRKSVAICQQDSVQRTLNFQLVDSGTALDMSNLLFAEILIHKADGYEADNGCVIDGDSVQYTLRSTDTSALGTNVAQLQLTFADGQVITTPTFEIEVYSKVLDQRVQTSTNEYTALTQQLVQVNELKNQTEEFKDSAEISAQTASEKAEEVVSSVEAAAQSALAAQSSANAAAQSVEQVETAASNAAESATNASTSATSAAASATTAREIADGIADDCQGYVTEAQTYAENALESFHAAEDEATNAQTSAEAASTSATNASTSASAASTSATNAAASEDNALDYAERAEEAYRKMGKEGLVLGETDSTAYRGDRGKIAYDHSQTTGNPHATTYSDVGADQAGAAAAAYQQAAGYTDLQIANLINGAPQNLDTLKEIADAIAKSQDVVDALQAAIGTTDISAIGDGTVTGGLYQLNNDLIDGVKRFVGENFAEIGTKEGSALAKRIYGMSVQDGTPTPSVPVEIKSAKADFKCVGKNLIPYPYRQERISSNPILINGVTWTVNADKTMSAVGTASGNNSNYYLTDWRDGYPLFRGGETYTLSGCPSGGNTTTYCLIFYGFLPNQSGSELTPAFHKFDTGNGVTFTIPQDCYGRIYCRVANETTAPTNAFKPMLTLVGANHTYEPYQYTDVTTDLTLRAIEVTSSDDYNLERDGKYYVADTVDWSEDEGYKLIRRIGKRDITSILSIGSQAKYGIVSINLFNPSDFILRKNTDTKQDALMSNRFKIERFYNYISSAIDVISYNSDIERLYLRNSEITSLNEWNEWLSNNPVEVYGVLKTPTTEPITSEQAQALLSLKTYDEATSISATGDIEPSVDLEYSKTNIGAKALTGHNEAASTRGNLTAEDNLQFQFSKSGSNYGYKDAIGNFVPFKQVQASKTVAAGTSAKTVTPDSGYHGIASVTVNPTPSQTKSVTATTSAQTVSPDSGKLLSSVTVNPQVHSRTRASVTSNGTIDLGANHATRYVPVNISPRLVGTYSANTTINISSLGATSASQFLLVCDTEASGWTGSWNLLRDYNRILSSHYYPPSITSFSSSSLTLSVGKIIDYVQADEDGHPINTAYVNLSTKVYFIG